MDKFRKDFMENFPDNKSIAVVAKEGGAKWKAMSESKLAEESKSNQCASSSSKEKMTILEILEFYETHHKFSFPRKVLIEQSFFRYMLRKGITKEAICDLLLTKDVQINVTSCNTKPLMRGKMLNKDEIKARISLALSLKELSCDLINTCLNSSDCLERLVLNENPSCYFVATKAKAFRKKLLQLPGVAVIGGRRGNLILNEPSVHQTKFVENKLKGKEVADVGECVLEHIGLTENSSGKRKVAKEGGAKWKAMSESEKAPYVEKAASEKAEMIAYYLKLVEELKSNECASSSSKPKVAKEGGAKWKAMSESKLAEESKSNQCASSSSKEKGKEVADVGECVLEQIGLTENSSRKRKNLSYADDETEMEKIAARRVKQKLQNKTEVEDEHRGCKTLFMGNLNFRVKKDNVENFFASVGRIKEVRLSQRKKKSAHFGHVEFLTAEAARQAIKLNGRKLLGRVIRLSYAEERLKVGHMFASGSKVSGSYVGNGRHGGHGQGIGYGFRGQVSRFGAGRGRQA